VLQGERAHLALVCQQADDPMHARSYQPPFELGQHDAADAPLPPGRREADAHQPGPGAADGRDRGPDQVVTTTATTAGAAAIRSDSPEHGRAGACRGVVPQPDRCVEIIIVKVPDPPRRH
jgi:hypothetical protein